VIHIWYKFVAGRPVTRGSEAPSAKFFAPQKKCVEHSLKLLDMV